MREAILIAKNRRPYSPIISGSRRRTQRFAAFSLKTGKRLVNRIQGVRLLRNGLRHPPLMVSS
jgi:hypothetical protein